MRAVYDTILARLRESGPVHEDAVTVGVFLKARRKIAEVRPMVRSVKVHLFLPRPVPGAQQATSSTWWLTVSITTDEVPTEVMELLDEAYDTAT